MARGALSWLSAGFDRQRGALFLWVPVGLSCGIGVYFSLKVEPAAPQIWLAFGLASLCAAVAIWLRAGLGLALMLPALICAGFALAAVRAHVLAAPVLNARIYGPVEGRIVEIDRSASGKLRLTLDQLVIGRLTLSQTPERVRISLQREQIWLEMTPGQRVILTASLAPPEGPVIPGGFDFRRYAWFHQLGAIGYSQTPVLLLENAQPEELRLARLRHHLATGIRRDLDGQTGAFAAAILAGDYDGLNADMLKALRASSLIHLISISGLHMVLLCGAVFWAVRLGLSLSRHAALHWPCRKIAALAALMAGAFYYLLSGGAIPAERAWVMIAVVFGAVLAGRRAISMHALALAAVVVLLLRPESLLDAGFQMSFAATLALVAGMEPALSRITNWPGWARTAAASVLSSMLAGFGSAAFAAAHFNRYADYGLLANLVAAPLMGLVVMPLCVIWMALLPVGLSHYALQFMGVGIDGVLSVGNFVADLPGATTMVPSPAPEVLPLLSIGGAVLAIWRGWGRLIGAPVILCALLLWQATERPEVLISAGGGLVGVMTEAGRSLSKPSGDGFAAIRWLEDDGDWVDQKQAALRAAVMRGSGISTFDYAGRKISHITGKGAEARIAASCADGDLIVTPLRLTRPGCTIWDANLTEAAGAIAMTTSGGFIVVRTAQEEAGDRLWTRRTEPDSAAGAPRRNGTALLNIPAELLFPHQQKNQ